MGLKIISYHLYISHMYIIIEVGKNPISNTLSLRDYKKLLTDFFLEHDCDGRDYNWLLDSFVDDKHCQGDYYECQSVHYTLRDEHLVEQFWMICYFFVCLARRHD